MRWPPSYGVTFAPDMSGSQPICRLPCIRGLKILPATAQQSDPKRPGCLTIKVEAFGVNSRIMQVGSKDLTPLCACESESEFINRFL